MKHFVKELMQKSKELFSNDGASHIQTYWKSEPTSQAVFQKTSRPSWVINQAT